MNIINIKDKEFYLVAILIVMFFGISAATITGSAVRDAIFLIKYEKKFLPLMYVIIAMVMTFVIEIYKRISTNKNPSTFFVLSGSFFIASLFVFHQNLFGPMVPFLYVWVEVITIIIILQFWMLASELLDARQAKRIFPIITAGGSFAAIGSGYLIKPFVKYYGSENLLLPTIGFLALSIFAGQLLKRYMPKKVSPKHTAVSKTKIKSHKLEPYLKHIAIMIACSAFISRLTDYQFKVMASNAFLSQNDLVSFFGTYYMVTGAATLLMQSVITGFVLTRFGILAGLIFLPLSLVFGSMAFLIFGSFAAVFVLKFSDQVFKFSMNNAVKEILWLPLSSIKRNRSKPFIDGTIKSFVEGIAGAAIFLLVYFNFLPDSKVYLLSLIVLLFALYWFWNSFRLKDGYLSEIVRSIENRQLNFDDLTFDINDSSTINTLKLSLEDTDEFKKLFAIDLLWTLPLEPWKETIQNQFLSGSNKVKRGILELCWSQREIITDDMIINQIHLKDEISPHAISCATDRNITKSIKDVDSYLIESNEHLKFSALVVMINDPERSRKAKEIVDQTLIDGSEEEITRLLHFLKHSDYDISEHLILKYLNSKNPELIDQTLGMISQKPQEKYLLQIIQLLENKSVSNSVEKALLRYDKKNVCEKLLKYFSSSKSTYETKISILGLIHQFEDKEIAKTILSSMDNPDLKFLGECTNTLIKVSKSYGLSNDELGQIRGVLNTLSKRAYQLHLFRDQLISIQSNILLIDHIEHDLTILRHLILKLGTLEDPTVPIESYIRYIDNRDTDLLPLVLELVDTTFSNQAKNLVLPLIDPELDPLSIASTILGKEEMSKDEMLKFWVENPHYWKTVIAIQFLINSGNDDVLRDIDWNQLPKSFLSDKYFSDNEKEYLSTMYMSNNFSNKESSNMFSVLEKTLLLKSVNLFKNIPGDILSKIAQLAEEVEIGFDEKLFDQGEHGDSLYIIIHGKISVTQNEKSITILEKGDCIGEMALLDQEPRSAGALAIVDSTLLKIDQEGFYELMSTNPEIMKQIVMILTQRVREMNEKVTSSL